MTAPLSFFEQLEARAQSVNSLLCVGLDPHPELLPMNTAAAARDFCFRLIEATADLACAFKPNSAFFEAFGSEGFDLLREVITRVPPGIPVILDAKRGDIASTAEAYARAAFDVLGASAITLSPYLGRDAIAPFVERPDKGVFILCKTSNPGADEIQGLQVGSHPLYEIVAARAAAWSQHNNVGLVVGATDISALQNVRRMTKTWFLVPGVGAQGGELEATIGYGLNADTRTGVLINISRSIARADDPRADAMWLRDAINACRAEIKKVIPPDPLENVARALAEAGCVRFGSFTLKSGKVSPIYIDLRRLVSYPGALQVIASAANRVLDGLQFDHIAAVPYAALPIGTAVSLLSGRSLIYARREVKEYGTKAAIEGVFASGERAVLLDDLATTGDTKFESIERLQSTGLVVKDIVVLIDREQGAARTLEGAGYNFHAVATLSQLLDIWQRQGVLSADQRASVDAYLKE
jgi:uridine monophosphate synthetase